MTPGTPAALTRMLLVTAWAAFATQYARAEAESPAVAALGERIEVAYQLRDLHGIEAAREELLSADSAGLPSRAGYFAAYARFRQGLVAAADPEQAADYIDQCITALRGYVQGNPADGEARALLGSCYGISTRYHRLGLASRGLEARRHMAAARQLAPQNPWVVLQDGLADFATPRLFGGDRDLAIAKLERATALFAAAITSGSRLAAWGAAETWSQLGQMYLETGRTADARVALERANSLYPKASGAAGLVASL